MVGRFARINPVAGKVSIVADGLAFEPPLPGASPTTIFNGVAFDPSGAIYVIGATGTYCTAKKKLR